MPPNPLNVLREGKGAKAVMSLADEVRAEMAAEKAYKAGVHYADPNAKPTMKFSEALGITGSEGKTLNFTETDRSRVKGENMGGFGFSGLQHYSPKHRDANAVWGFGSEEIAKRKIKNSDPEKDVFTTYIGSPDQHKSNSIVVRDALKNVQAANQQNLLDPAQINLINKRIRAARSKTGTLLFPSDFDVTDAQAMNAATTFDRRTAISNALMGVGVQGAMKKLDFKKANPNVEYKDPAQMDSILRRESEPMLEGLPNYSVGPRLFTLDGGLLYRPDLNFAFPNQPTGTDMGVMFEMPTIQEAAPQFMKKKGYKPKDVVNARAMSMGAPSQFVDEAYLTYLQKIGRKKGGLAKMAKGGVPRGIKKLKGIYNEVETSMGRGKGADFEQTASPLNIMREGTGQWTGKNLDVQLKDLEDEAFSPAYQKAIEDSLKVDRARAAAGDKAAQARIPTFEKVLAQGLAKKQWVNSNLKNYVKKQMASPNDPVRALAEKGVTHIRDNGQAWRGGVPQAETNRMRAGLPTLGSGQSVEAKAWETLSDNSMSSMLPEDVPLSLTRGNEWIKDLPEDERVLFYTHAPELGFEKLLQHIDTKLDAGEIRPDQLNKVSVADAVKGVHDKRVSEEDLAKQVMQSNAATKVVKEYPNGYKWVEISANKDSPLPEGYEQLPNGTYVDPQGQGSIHNPNYIAMQDALTHEGNIMGHCVGDYCDEVYNKGTKILSLRDPKGESHATVQVLPQENGPPRIKQIKGKQDEPLIGKYRPMMADLANTGEYSYIDELHNAGLKEKSTVLDAHEEEWLKSKGYQVPKYLLQEDIDVMLKALDDNGVPPIPKEGMAKGGVPKGIKAVDKIVNQVKAEMGIDRVNMAHKDVLKRTPEIQEAAALLEQGKLSPLQYKAIVDKYKPITPYASVPNPASEEDIIGALTKTNREAQGLPPKQSYYGVPSRTLAEGDPVGLRLDIPSYDTANTWVVTAHGPRKSQASGGAGTRIGYEPVASATDVNFSVSPKAALGIAKGASKSTIATMEGKWKPTNAAEAKAAAELYLKDPDWVQVGMDPERHSYFYDRKTRQPVIGAEQVIQIGPLVLAKKPKYGKHEDFPFAGGGLANMAKGGAAKGAKKIMSLADQVRAEMAAEKAVLPTATRDANLAKFLEPSAAKMRLYHGTTATEGGKGKEAIRRLKPSKEGSLGSGVYMTPSAAHASSYSGIPNDEAIDLMRGSQYTAGMADQFMADRASGTLREGQVGGNMLPVHVQMRNPLIIGKSGRGIDPAADALMSLGMDEANAVKLVEKAYEEKGNIGKQIQSRAQAQGYDGIMQYRGDTLSEVVSFNPSAVKSAIGNQGTYDTSFPDLSKAHGGIAHMAKGGRGVRGVQKAMSLADEVRAEMAAEKAAKLANPPANVKVEPAYPYQDRLNKVKPVYGARAILPREKADANKAAFMEPSVVKDRLYHGTKRNFTRFSPTTADSIFLTPDPTFASGFAHGSLQYKDPYSQVAHGRFSTPEAKFLDPQEQVDNANILPVRVQVRNPFDYENPEHVEALRDWMLKNETLPKDRLEVQLQHMTDPELSANWTQMENPKFQEGIKALGHDAYYTKELDTKNLGVYNPNMVKSDIGNIGTWSTKTPEITEKKGGLV